MLDVWTERDDNYNLWKTFWKTKVYSYVVCIVYYIQHKYYCINSVSPRITTSGGCHFFESQWKDDSDHLHWGHTGIVNITNKEGKERKRFRVAWGWWVGCCHQLGHELELVQSGRGALCVGWMLDIASLCVKWKRAAHLSVWHRYRLTWESVSRNMTMEDKWLAVMDELWLCDKSHGCAEYWEPGMHTHYKTSERECSEHYKPAHWQYGKV